MKKVFAILGVVLLVGLYITTFIFAFFVKGEMGSKLFNASLYATFIVPVLLYVYMMFYKMLNKKDDE